MRSHLTLAHAKNLQLLTHQIVQPMDKPRLDTEAADSPWGRVTEMGSLHPGWAEGEKGLLCRNDAQPLAPNSRNASGEQKTQRKRDQTGLFQETSSEVSIYSALFLAGQKATSSSY